MFYMRFLLRGTAIPRSFSTAARVQQRTGFASQNWSTASRIPFERTGYASQSWAATSRAGGRVKWQETFRRAQQQRGYRRQAFNYQRFNSTRGLFQRWAARPTFYYEIGGIGAAFGGFYIINLEEVPVSGRKRFNIVAPTAEASQGMQAYAQTLQEFRGQLMPPSSREHRLVQRVLNRLIPHSGITDQQWEVHVINDDMKNAFVVPGGKVFVFRGMLDLCAGDENKLAAVLGHEIAHNVAHHAAERMSQTFILLPIAWIASLMIGVDPGIGSFISKLAFELPGSRAQESEADFIGLLMMADACYDPTAAMELWAIMEGEEKGQAPPQFMSTHPSSHGRMERIREWLPQAQDRLESGGCGGGLAGYAGAFRREVVGRDRF